MKNSSIKRHGLNRRQFIHSSALLAGTALLSPWALSSVRAAGAPELARLRSRSREAEAWARALSPGQAGRILDALLRAGGQVAAYAQPRLLLETLFLDTFAAIPAPPAVA